MPIRRLVTPARLLPMRMEVLCAHLRWWWPRTLIMAADITIVDMAAGTAAANGVVAVTDADLKVITAVTAVGKALTAGKIDQTSCRRARKKATPCKRPFF